jgi:uncharacterized protein (DUF433 family)
MEHSITIRNTDVKITDVLDMISRGCSYKQIIEQNAGLTLGDIMAAAKTALALLKMVVIVEEPIKIASELRIVIHNGKMQSLAEVRKKYPRAYEKWTEDEEKRLVALYRGGKKIGEIAGLLQRQWGAVRIRLEQLGEIENSGYAGSSGPRPG